MSLKEKLNNNQLTIGSWVTLGHQGIIEIMSTAGFDWLTIDLEHSVIELTMAQNLIAHIKNNGMYALIRVSKNEEVVIKRVMDAGADGVIVPLVKNKDDAIHAVEFVKYPPVGKRGVGLARAQKYGIGFDEYKDWVKNESIVIAQIEHIDAVNNIDDILSVQGIDGTIIGPYDLSGSMGIPGEYDKKEVKDAIKKIEAACKKYKKSLGFHVVPPDFKQLKEKIDAGYTFLAYSLDFLFLGEKVREEMKKVKEIL
jgi:2-dehydro-3-deoxyglucarate aldolase